MGHWELVSSVPLYTNRSRVPAGHLYGLGGEVIIKPSANLTEHGGFDLAYPFYYGIGPNPGESARDWDRRLTVRKPCSGFAACGASDAPGACEVVCSPETLTCVSGSTPVTQPDLADCSTSEGATGFCCGGSCQTDGTCAACSL